MCIRDSNNNDDDDDDDDNNNKKANQREPKQYYLKQNDQKWSKEFRFSVKEEKNLFQKLKETVTPQAIYG